MSESNKRRVMLDADGTITNWCAVIVEAPTGVIYENQCNGVACDVCQQEGYLVILGGMKTDVEDGIVSSAELTAIFHHGKGVGSCHYAMFKSNLSPERLELLRKTISSIPYWSTEPSSTIGSQTTRTPLCLDESRLEQVVEAWVPVLTTDGRAILVWDNCD